LAEGGVKFSCASEGHSRLGRDTHLYRVMLDLIITSIDSPWLLSGSPEVPRVVVIGVASHRSRVSFFGRVDFETIFFYKFKKV
jgi:hypothetical protein